MSKRSKRSKSSPAPADGSGGSDPLAAVIALLRPQTVVSKVISGAGRWSVRYDDGHLDPGFCLMLEGECFLDIDGVGPTRLEAGDFVLVPAVPGFTMASDLAIEPRKAQPIYTGELRHGRRSGPASMRQLGGYFRFDRANARLVVNFLPTVIHIRRDDPGADRVRRVTELIREEALENRPGRELILERLVEVLLVEALRFRPASASSQEQGLLAGLSDPALARALRRMHDEVARRWTIADLARAAGMSRASFAERFSRRVGMPPMTYLQEWRMAIAKDALQRQQLPLSEVAELIGYRSASAFSTAFSRHTGCSPSEFSRSGA
ncbi:AraC family transcriptional regulator [Pseudenhygromyxa sp. WMMC2535]|uniref:AraC family transcriptional regulator n=1 Tax=Pseudenhygromyxa sp. WMMC2535 TaxID=2712867 RepID=UPI001551AD39|nr:AraC family transcriptional regulator [Pseudenhygromyxa sp. WMMC2535]NVB41428.1 AraC family transcriptional regulator [Pseudenhygromyxa sp. WMMC2535]